MPRTKGSPDVLKQVQAFDLALQKHPYPRIAQMLGVSERSIKRWIQAERVRREELVTPSVREEVLLQADQALATAWTNYHSQKTGTPARSQALSLIFEALKFRAELYGLGIDSEVRREIDELKAQAELARRLAVNKIAPQRDTATPPTGLPDA
jgi:hypothetical protein